MYCKLSDTSLFFDVDGALLQENGPEYIEKPTIIMLHGGPGADHSSTRSSFLRLTEFAQIIYLDQRYQGRSERGSFEGFSLDQSAEDLKDFCDTMGIDKPIIFGHSFGGMVAMKYAEKYPDHPRKLILVSTFSNQNLPSMFDMFQSLGGEEARLSAEKFWVTPTLESLQKYKEVSGIHTNRRFPHDAFERSLRMISNSELCCYFWRDEGKKFDLRNGLRMIQCPTLVIGGDSDPVAPPSCIEEMAINVPENYVKKVILEDCGHMFWYDQPDTGFKIIEDFIQENEERNA